MASSPPQKFKSNEVASEEDLARVLNMDSSKMALDVCSVRLAMFSGALGLGLLSQAVTPVLAAPTVQVFNINITEPQVLTA